MESEKAMLLPEGTWRWAWNGFLRWSLNPTMLHAPNARERWAIAMSCIWPGIKHHYLSPMQAGLQRTLPVAVAIARLENHGAGWYRIPSMPAAIHVWRRTGVHVLEGDFAKIKGGVVTMKGYEDEELQACEFWQVDPTPRASAVLS